MNKPEYLIIHHTGGTDANPLQDSANYTVEQCSNDHKARFGMKSRTGLWCGYHYMIDKNGKRWQTRFDDEEGAHARGYNSKSLGICLMGNFDAFLPTQPQIDELKKIMKEKSDYYKIPLDKIIPHRGVAQKTCYGMRLPEAWARSLLKTTNQPLTKATIGDNSPNIERIQEILTKKGYVLSPFTKGLYDENMAQSVLLFQLENKVADNKELSKLRGELIGNKTLKCLTS